MKFSNLSRVYTTSRIYKNQIITLNGNIFHYYKSVLRKKVSQKFRLFNQIDGEFEAKITSLDKNVLEASIVKKLRKVEYQKNLILAMSLVRSDRFLEAIKGAVQQGITEVMPIISERTQFSSINHQRINKCIIEAVEESEGFMVPILHSPINLKKLYDISEINQIIFANEDEDNKIHIASIKKLNRNIAVLIGPEGGFSKNEKEKLISNPKVISVSLGKRVLRSEVAATSMIGCINLIREHLCNGFDY